MLVRRRRPISPVLFALALACSPPPTQDHTTKPPPDGTKTVADLPDPEPVDLWGWLMGEDGSGTDAVGAAVDAGTFAFPDGASYGIDWRVVDPQEDGTLASVSTGLPTWAVTRFSLPAGEHLFADGESVAFLYAGGRRQPGDVYHSGRSRVPLPVADDVTVVLARLLPTGRTPKVALWHTKADVWLNTADPTDPDLVVGQQVKQYLGLPLLNLSGRPLSTLSARVVESDDFEASERTTVGLAPGAVTQVAFDLVPKHAWAEADRTVTVRLHVESPDLEQAYEQEIELKTVAAGVPYRRTRISRMDGSVQYYAVNPPSDFDPQKRYALVLSLHGAAVQALNQARSYSQKDWAFLVAPTNRRPFGFDWESFGRLDAIEALDDAMAAFPIDETRVHLTGHSMGGHGTWHLGVNETGRFATIAPSAGWISFQTYGGQPAPQGAFARSQAASNTLAYVTNLASKAVYILHGDADRTVPVTEARHMRDVLTPIVPDLYYHEEPGADHWWDGDASPGVDCVDWPPIFDLMQQRTVDPHETDFDWITPAPWINAARSYVTVRSAADAWQDVHVTSARSGDTVTLTTENVRSLVLDGAALAAKGVETVVVDGDAHPVDGGEIAIGPQDGKRPDVYGPFTQVFFAPFCFVYPDGSEALEAYAGWLVSNWTLLGNGHACAVPASRVDADLRAERNLVWLNPDPAMVDLGAIPVTWDAGGVHLAGQAFDGAASAFVFPSGDRLSAAMTVPAGDERLLYMVQPFTSGFDIPDYLVWSERGGLAAGFFDAEWHWAP